MSLRLAPGVCLGLLLAMLGGCTSPAMDFELLSPKPGEVGARVKARLIVTGTDDVSFDSSIKVIEMRHPDREFRSATCYQGCKEQEFQLPSGSYEVFGTMTYLDRNGEEQTLTSERYPVEIDAIPVVAAMIPPLPPTTRELKFLVTKPVLESSVNTDTLTLQRTFQSGPTRLRMTTEPVPIEVSLSGRIITVWGDLSAPAQYVLSMQGVRDAPGNEVHQDFPFVQHYFTHGPDLGEYTAGQLERLERDDQQRLYHLSLDRRRSLQIASRLEGTTWVELATLPLVNDFLATIDRQGRPVSISGPILGEAYELKRWNGSAWEVWGPRIPESSAWGFVLTQVRVDARNRPLVLVSAGSNAPYTELIHLYRLDGATWTLLPHSIPTGTVNHTFFPLGSSIALGWASRPSGGESLAARIDEGGLTPLTVPPGVNLDWSHAVSAGEGQCFVPGRLATSRSSVLHYDGASLSEVGDMRGYLDPSDPGGGNTIWGTVRTLAVDETGAPTVFMQARIYAGTTGGEQVFRFLLSALRFDGRAWTPLRGAPAAVLQSGEPEVSWMSTLAVGSLPVALDAAFTPEGALWMLQLRGYESGRVARSYVLRAHHAP